MDITYKLTQNIPLPGVLRYLPSEQAVEFEARDRFGLHLLYQAGTIVIAMDTLEIQVAVPDGQLLHVDGYFPRPSWTPSALPKRLTKSGNVYFDVVRIMKIDTISRLVEALTWKRFVDVGQKVVEFRPDAINGSVIAVEFSTSQCALISGNTLIGFRFNLDEIEY